MATMQERISALAGRIRDQFNAINPRLLPAGGLAGNVLAKSSGADNAVAWVSPPCGFATAIQGKPLAGERIGPFVADRAFTFPNGMATSISSSGAAADAAQVFGLERNGAIIATVSYAKGAVTGAFATSTNADVAVARGDRFFLVCPDPQDAALTDLGFTFVGVR